MNCLIPTTTLTTPDHRERKTICLLLLRLVGIVHISCSTVNVCVMGVIVGQHLRTASVGVASTYTLFLVLFCLHSLNGHSLSWVLQGAEGSCVGLNGT